MFRIRTCQPILIPKRWKNSKTHWSVLQKKIFPKDRALESFDDFYGSVFGHRWKSIRAALLTQKKYVALVNNFGDADKLCKELEAEGAINLKSLVNLYKNRLEPVDNTPSNQSTALDKALKKITKTQESREIFLIYPDNTTEIPEKLTVNETSTISKIDDSETKLHDDAIIKSADYKKPLEQSLEEDMNIDLSRIADPTENNLGALYEFVPATKIKGMEDFVPESDHYKYYSTTTDFPLNFELETSFEFPDNLLIYTYEKGNCSDFFGPKNCETGVQSHYLMDGASILPPLMLDIQKGDRVLDACAAPGGKSMIMLQTLHPKMLICNDIQESRVNRIRRVMKQFVFDYEEKWEGNIVRLQQHDARTIDDLEKFDKILVDVPCTTDRHALLENDNNIFKPSRIKERLKIPEMQAAILTNCLKLLRPGGSLVYSTCSLSPVQNDGVVHMALQKIFTEYGMTATIKDLSHIIKLFNDIFKFEISKNLKYGQLVLPFLPANYGPMYFCKITKN